MMSPAIEKKAAEWKTLIATIAAGRLARDARRQGSGEAHPGGLASNAALRGRRPLARASPRPALAPSAVGHAPVWPDPASEATFLDVMTIAVMAGPEPNAGGSFTQRSHDGRDGDGHRSGEGAPGSDSPDTKVD
jgi:hypothetical protein